MTTIFVTSSGTGIGKTFVTLRLLAELGAAGISARAIKPIASGFEADAEDSDTQLLLRAQHLRPTPANLAALSPWRFAAPLSPDVAAAREGRRVPFDELVAFCQAPSTAAVTLIEGVGGVMVPLTQQRTTLDWMAALGAPALLVVGSYLGALSHALSAALALQTRRVPLAAVVVSESAEQPMPARETALTLERFLQPTPVRVLSRGGTEPLLPLVAPLCARPGPI